MYKDKQKINFKWCQFTKTGKKTCQYSLHYEFLLRWQWALAGHWIGE